MFRPLSLDAFLERTGIDRHELAAPRDGYDLIVSMRDLSSVTDVQAMPRPYLMRLLRSVTLAGGPGLRPYDGSEIETLRVDAEGLRLGQTFIEGRKCLALLARFSAADELEGFCITRGIAKRTAYIVFGRTADGRPALAHYLPPILEEHAGRLILMDGVHRCFLARAIGTTIETIIVRSPAADFPADVRGWGATRIVDEKPPKDERFFGLRPGLFRDLKSVGIDG